MDDDDDDDNDDDDDGDRICRVFKNYLDIYNIPLQNKIEKK